MTNIPTNSTENLTARTNWDIGSQNTNSGNAAGTSQTLTSLRPTTDTQTGRTPGQNSTHMTAPNTQSAALNRSDRPQAELTAREKLTSEAKKFFDNGRAFVEKNGQFLHPPERVVQSGIDDVGKYLESLGPLPEKGIRKVADGEKIIDALEKLGEANTEQGGRWKSHASPRYIVGTSLGLDEIGYGKRKGEPRFIEGGGTFFPLKLKSAFSTFEYLGKVKPEEMLKKGDICEFDKTGVTAFSVGRSEIGVGEYNGETVIFGQGTYVASKEFTFLGKANFEHPAEVVTALRNKENEHEGPQRDRTIRIETGRYQRVGDIDVVRASIGCPAVIQSPDGTAKAVDGLYITKQGEKANSRMATHKGPNQSTVMRDEVDFADTQYYASTLTYNDLDNNRGFKVIAEVSVDVAVIDPVQWEKMRGAKWQPIDQIDETLRSTLIQHIGTLGEAGCKYIQQDFSEYETLLRAELNKNHGQQYGYYIRKLDLKRFEIPEHKSKNEAEAAANIAAQIREAKAVTFDEDAKREKLQQEMEAKKAAYIEQTLRRDIAEKQETARAEQDKVMKDLDYELRQAELAADIELAKTKGEVGAKGEKELHEHRVLLQKAKDEATQTLDIKRLELEAAEVEKQRLILEAEGKAEQIRLESEAMRANESEIKMQHALKMQELELEAMKAVRVSFANALAANPNAAITNDEMFEKLANLRVGYPSQGTAVFAPYHKPSDATLLTPPMGLEGPNDAKHQQAS